ncbi:outer membrane protein assembly factor BamE domain-containing protein [Moellerella wisconsensis]|uniref:outer membrane protein assembly factor BamE domain-containing protein n=1 Tax=Moellerella wisconsensis TaxID=158849 RepID=UPI001F4D726B|nr:outer membrane protein assembly factor BamE [Moellerella wisconsensis]UNH28203.1 outer membrane protein assembly factor BamE [Moellerella wisconsensis]
MKGLLIALTLSVSALTLVGCAKSTNYNQKSAMLSLGMEKAEVQSILGAPKRTDVNQERERWIYWSPVYYGFTMMDNEQLATDRLVVTFTNGKVNKWGQQSLTDDMMEFSERSIKATAEIYKQK